MSYGITHKDHNKALSIIEKRTKHENTTFMLFDNSKVYLSEMSTRLLVNPQKYLEELEERVDAPVQYAKVYGLCEMMITITTRKEDNIDVAYEKISEIWRDITKMPAWYKIQSGRRIFFRIVEPMKNGMPHFHILIWIPPNNVEAFLDALFKKFRKPQIDVMSKIIPKAYEFHKKDHKNKGTYIKSGNTIVKINDTMVGYILKNIEEISKNIGEEKLDDLSVWYILFNKKDKKVKKIFSMTIRLFAPIDVYRKMKRHYSLFDLTMGIKSKDINIYRSKKNLTMIMNTEEIIWEAKYREIYSDRIPDTMIKKIDKKYLRPPHTGNNEKEKNILVAGTMKSIVTHSGYSRFEITQNTSFEYGRNMTLDDNKASLPNNTDQIISEKIDALQKAVLLDNKKNKDEIINKINVPKNKKQQHDMHPKYIDVRQMEIIYSITKESQKSFRNRIEDPLRFYQDGGDS